MNLDKKLLALTRLAWFPLILTVLLGFFGGLLAIAQAWSLTEIIAGVFLDGKTLTDVQPVLTVLFLVILLRSASGFFMEFSAGKVAFHVKRFLRTRLIQTLLKIGPAYLEGEKSGELTSSVMEGIEALDPYFNQYLPQLALAALIPFVMLLVVFPIDLLTGVIFLLTAPLIPFFMILIGKTVDHFTHRQWVMLTRMSNHFLDTIQGLVTLKTLGISMERESEIAEVSNAYRIATLNVLRLAFLSSFVLELVSTISTAIVAVQIGLRLLYDSVSFREAFLILLIAPEFYLPLRTLGMRFHAGASGMSAFRRITEILNLPLPVEKPVIHTPAFNFWNDKSSNELVLNQVTFKYPGRSFYALEDVSLKISSGERIAIVGQSGGGKSTILKLLLRFIDPTAGKIMVNNLPFSEIPVAVWRSQIAWVPQTPVIFHGSVADNIRLGKTGALQSEVIWAARQALLDDFIKTLPDGYDTFIGEQGTRLSSGQVQRIALARAFIKDAPILFMDEPTAHLDPEQEEILKEAVYRLFTRRTSVIIAHRIPTVVHSDKIIVLDHGKIVEQGNHNSLINQKGQYSVLVRHYQGEI